MRAVTHWLAAGLQQLREAAAVVAEEASRRKRAGNGFCLIAKETLARFAVVAGGRSAMEVRIRYKHKVSIQ